MLQLEQDKGCPRNPGDAVGVEADPTQGLEGDRSRLASGQRFAMDWKAGVGQCPSGSSVETGNDLGRD